MNTSEALKHPPGAAAILVVAAGDIHSFCDVGEELEHELDPGRHVSHQSPGGMRDRPPLTSDEHDWDWLVGHWSVRHRRLKERLTGSTEWEEFSGTCVNWRTLGGKGNVDDYMLELPSETYRAVAIRALDPASGEWSIWWLDSRKATIEPPVRGGFKDGVGTFLGADTSNGKPVTVRFYWTKITPSSAHWEQAFSPDGGATWETNWEMNFTRVPKRER